MKVFNHLLPIARENPLSTHAVVSPDADILLWALACPVRTPSPAARSLPSVLMSAWRAPTPAPIREPPSTCVPLLSLSLPSPCHVRRHPHSHHVPYPAGCNEPRHPLGPS